MKAINIILITLIAIISCYILIEKFKMLDQMRDMACDYICRKKKEKEKFTLADFGKIIDESVTKIEESLNNSQQKSAEGFDSFNSKTLLLENNKDEDIDMNGKYFTLEQVDKDEDKLTKYIREIALGAKYSNPTEHIKKIPKSDYVSGWITMNDKINKTSDDYEDEVDRINRLYLTSGNELTGLEGKTIKNVYDDLTKTNKDKFEKAFEDGKMDTYRSDQWYYDPKLNSKVGNFFGSASSNILDF